MRGFTTACITAPPAEVGAAMGKKNGQYAVQNYLQPIAQAAVR